MSDRMTEAFEKWLADDKGNTWFREEDDIREGFMVGYKAGLEEAKLSGYKEGFDAGKMFAELEAADKS